MEPCNVAAVRLQGRSQAEQPQVGRVELVRETVNPFEYSLRLVLEPGQRLLRGHVLYVASRTFECIDQHGNAGQLLRHAVVQVAGESRAGDLLCVDEPSGESANALIARSQRRLSCQYRCLRAPPAGPLRQEPRDEEQLRQDHEPGTDNVRPVRLKGSGLPELDVRSWWKPRRVDTPALQLTPIEGRHAGRRSNREVLRPRTVENLPRQFSKTSPDRPAPPNHAPYNPTAEEHVCTDVDWYWRDPCHQAYNLVRIHPAFGIF